LGLASSDFLHGEGGNDSLEGGAGSDTYVFGANAAGDDTINEAAGLDSDTLDFFSFGSAIEVNLGDTTANYPVATGLRLTLTSSTGVENVRGTAFADTITGNLRNNNLQGGDGNDTMLGMAGADTLFGQGGTDVLNAGGDPGDFEFQ
jgi:Ca2+-binding RTX toxin-like protein